MRLLPWKTAHLSRLLTCAAIAFVAVACSTNSEPDGDVDPIKDCLSNEKFFAQEVWGPILSQNCIACHNAQGDASQSKFILQREAQTGYLEANMKALQSVARYEVDGTSIVLLKPTARIEHGGGLRLQLDSPEYKALEEMLARYDNPIECGDQTDGEFFAKVRLLDAEETLRAATLNLAGRLPSEEEVAVVRGGGEAALDGLLDDVLTEDAFYDRLKEYYNDLFLTDRYYSGDRAIQLLDTNDYPDARFYDELEGVNDELRDALRGAANRAVAREVLELVAHVVRSDRPFSEVLTADYVLVNGFSARVYGVPQFAWAGSSMADFDMIDQTLFYEATLTTAPGLQIPHAGVLTSHMFMSRFPTTPTNRNRHRSRMVQSFFLATDILKLAERPIDSTGVDLSHNPTLNNTNCTVCHAVMDPLAGLMKNWSDAGRYRPEGPEQTGAWYQDMRAPGFSESQEDHMPSSETTRGVQWMAERIVADPRFVTAVIRQAYGLVIGDVPLGVPTAETSNRAAAQRAYDAQAALFTQIGNQFAEDMDFKKVVKALVKSPYFRAVAVEEAMSADRRAELDAIGVGKLLTPEALHRKIEAVTGRTWERYGTPELLSTSRYKMFYGGIDSDSVTQRIGSPNGLMANIQIRMANEISCLVSARDFTSDAADRRMFPHVERTFMPEDENGFEIPSAVASIRKNIQHLHKRVLGEELSLDDPEIDRTYQLFLETWREGRAGVVASELSRDVNWECRAESEDIPEERRFRSDPDYTVRAWSAVLTYLLSDYGFLYE